MTSPRTSQRNRHACARTIVTLQQDGGYALLWKHYDNNNMTATCYYGNVQQQYGGYALLWKRYDINKMAAMRCYENVMTTTKQQIWPLRDTMETL